MMNPIFITTFAERNIIQVSDLYFEPFGIGPDAMYSVRHNAVWLKTLTSIYLNPKLQ
jgi:hypothetical protein